MYATFEHQTGLMAFFRLFSLTMKKCDALFSILLNLQQRPYFSEADTLRTESLHPHEKKRTKTQQSVNIKPKANNVASIYVYVHKPNGTMLSK